VTPDGAFTRLAANIWLNPRGALVLGDDGDFYGTARSAVFKITINGDVTTVALLTNDDNDSA